MKERPILFSSPMVRAILDGRKTQTRRVVKHVPMLGDPLAWCAAAAAQEPGWVNIVGDYKRFCPHGQPGDRIWVRENCWIAKKRFGDPSLNNAKDDDGDGRAVGYSASMGGYAVRCALDYGVKQSPSIHMPRWASRITLEIVSVKVERLQEISYDDAAAEGVEAWGEHGKCPGCNSFGCSQPAKPNGRCEVFMSGYKDAFQSLWDSLNEKRGFGWKVNPWVWVIEFRRIK